MMKFRTFSAFVSPRFRQQVQRTLGFGAGAIAAAVVSATASYGIVKTLYPREAEPMALAAPLPDFAPSDNGLRAATLPAPARAIEVTPLGPVAEPSAAETAALAPLSPSTPDAAPLRVQGEASASPDPVRQSAAPVMPEVRPVAGLDTPSAAATSQPVETSRSAEAFAALASREAEAIGTATLAFARAPVPVRPEAVALATVAIPDMPRTRPAPRPDDIPAIVAAAMIPSIRPAPRPDLIRVAAADRSAPRAASASARCTAGLARAIPRRPADAMGGAAFFKALGGLSGTDRDQRVIAELARGNLPEFLRQLQPVTFRGPDSRGVETEIVICVTADYLALGSERDHVRVPLGLPAAAEIAGRFGMTLPTPRMVDAIYAQADVRLSPAPMTPGPQMSSTDYFLRHNATIEGQLHGRGGLVAGQKKDLVLASRLAAAPGRVAIYGWHRRGGDPIQPVSTVHGATYADYSHGIRLVSKTAFLNGREVNLDELLGSSRYAYLLNQDGPLPGQVIRTASR